MNRFVLLAALAPIAANASSGPTCAEVVKRFGNQLADVNCFQSTDLTTNNPLTTPADNSIATLPAFAWTPQTDRSKIAPTGTKKTPITSVVPGLQLNARIASDPTGQARFLLRLPNNWNGDLVVAGASGTRSEFNGDFAWSDYVVQKGFAYASQNKGVLNFTLAAVTASPTTLPADPLACRLNPASPVWVHFYDNDPAQQFTRWAQYMIIGGLLAQQGVASGYGRAPKHTYAVGTSNGGYQVRRAIEAAPYIFDGGVDWEGTYVDEIAPNLLTDLASGNLNYTDYAASGLSSSSTAYSNLLLAGYPPDIVNSSTSSLWTSYWGDFWEVTECQWQKRLDPTYNTYGAGMGHYNYTARRPFTQVGENLDAFATTGLIYKPLITVAGTMDSLLPIDHHARAYERAVRSHDHNGFGGNGGVYRLYEVQNGNHIEAYQDTFPQLELIEPHAQHALDLLVQSVEQHVALPPSQCIPHGGAIASSPSQPGHCANLYVAP
jgi:hypothetical protein